MLGTTVGEQYQGVSFPVHTVLVARLPLMLKDRKTKWDVGGVIRSASSRRVTQAARSRFKHLLVPCLAGLTDLFLYMSYHHLARLYHVPDESALSSRPSHLNGH